MLKFLLLFAMIISLPLKAAEEICQIFVTASRIAEPLEKSGNAVSVISGQEIEDRQWTKVEDALKTLPGVSLTRQGGKGSSGQIRIRGSEPNHTLVLIDGQRVNYQDALYNFDFDWLDTNDIERIEILRGPAASQWGSDAIGGVVNIITKKGKGPMQISALAEIGSFNSNRESLGLRGGGERFDYNLNLHHQETEGWSSASASDKRGYGKERDGSWSQGLSAKLGAMPTENIRLEARYAHTDFKADNDKAVATGSLRGTTADANRAKWKHVDSGYFKGEGSWFEDLWQSSLALSAIRNDQWYSGDQMPFGGVYRAYEGTTTAINWQNDLNFSRNVISSLGFESTTDRYRQVNYDDAGKLVASAALTTNSLFFQQKLRPFEDLDLSGGLRRSEHETFGDFLTWRTAAAWHILDDTTLKGSYGTAFKAPMLFQIYYAAGTSNLDLKPEESRGWDVGVERKLAQGRVKIGTGWFHNNITNLIEFVGTGLSSTDHYINASKATTYGNESFFQVALYEDAEMSLDWGGNYTYTRAFNRATDAELTRRPRHKAASNLAWLFFGKKAKLNLETIYSSNFQENRNNSKPYAAQNRHGKYVEFNLAGGYELKPGVEVFGRVDNLTDTYHESAWGYAETGGRAFYIGLKLNGL